MAKKPTTREELLAQLETLDNSTEINTLNAEVSRLTEENASLVLQRRELERQLKQERDAVQIIRDALRTVDIKTRPLSAERPGYAEMQEAAARASRLELTTVRLGIQKGTHDPATGLPYTADTKPQRVLIAGTPKVTDTELASFFPSLSGPEVDVTVTADTVLDAHLSEHKTALDLATGN
ncbi:hypothetical protein [Mesorhizobium sp. M7A.F.Ca.US.008.03.1.1]|uniref:hypothetical protein n=1 Tax=Mesorhizobium sp. M7A.F.Ca.US.008.03.1.1 TaxID=2496742 RepID=UPI000FC9BDA0|nr:hypothetical protein [Mesorhizobium sp. M7A.F.Ca.US.008.03.1.1]RUW62424.1 hypothetical protein EOA16_09380 [Mesorhizobium sp. M7A.F.Ca.US.008.03.1.1]